jgi:hypothetical protein
VKPVNPVTFIAAATGQPVGASAGLPLGAVWRGFGVPAVNEAGDIAFLGRWASRAGRGEGIWVQRAESELLEPVIKRGASISGSADLSLPPAAQVGALQDPIIAPNGDVLVPTALMGPRLDAARGSAVVWSPGSDRASARVILHAGQQFPGASGARLAAIKGVALGSGGVAFHARLKRGSGVPTVTAADDSVFGVWDEANGIRFLAQTGQPFGNSFLTSFTVPLITPSAPGHDRAWANLEPGVPPRIGLLGKLADGSQVLFSAEDGAGDLLLVQTQPSTSVLPAGGDAFAKLRVPAWSGRVDTAVFAGTLRNGGEGIFLVGTEGIKSIHRPGMEIDTGVFVRSVQDPIAAPDGTLAAWLGTLRGRGIRSDNDEALFLRREGSVASVLAREGNPAADCPPGAVYYAFQSAALSRQGLIFRGRLRVERSITGANDECLWAQSVTGQTRLILREGQAVDGTILLGFNVLNATPGTFGARRAYSDSGWLVALGSLPRGQTAILKIRLP